MQMDLFNHDEVLSFPPIASGHPKILILGSAPGMESIKLNQYYGNKRNSFWKIMGEIFSFDHNLSYSDRKDYLIKSNVAVWDVIDSCSRVGSLDGNIKSIQINDFSSFLSEHQSIEKIFFNGSLPEKEYTKRVIPTLPIEFQDITYLKLPSTSSAMAALRYEEKLERWKVILS